MAPAAGVSSAGPAPTIAGMPSARAMIAVWEVGPPAAVPKPSTRAGSMAAVSDGVRSSAISTTGWSGSGGASSSTSASWRSTRLPTSCMSTARAASTGSSTFSSSPARSSITARHAHPADSPPSTRRSTSSSRSGSSRNASWARKIAAFDRAGARRHVVVEVAQLGLRRLDRAAQAPPLGLRVTGGALDDQLLPLQVPDRSDRQAGRHADARDGGGVAGRRPGHRHRSGGEGRVLLRGLVLAEPALDGGAHGGERGLRIGPVGEEGELGAGVGAERQQRREALAVGEPVAPGPLDPHVGGEALGDVDERGGRSGVEAAREVEHDLGRPVPAEVDRRLVTAAPRGRPARTSCRRPGAATITCASVVVVSSSTWAGSERIRVRLARIWRCSSDAAAIPTTSRTVSPGFHSRPPGTCTTEIAVARIRSRSLRSPWGMAMPSPRYVLATFSRPSIDSA